MEKEDVRITEAYLQDICFEVAIANELLEKRTKLYLKIYPKTHQSS